jgi:hypothetical protein
MMSDNHVGYAGISFHDILGNPENIRSAAMDFQPSLKRWTSCGCSICFHGPLGQGERTDVLVILVVQKGNKFMYVWIGDEDGINAPKKM